MSADDRASAIARLTALMSMTTTNGCTEEEEMAAARKVARLIADLDGRPGESGSTDASWAARERDNPEYKALLEKNTLEGLLKTALQELAMGHINTVSPPRRDLRGKPVEYVSTVDLLRPYFAMMLGSAGASHLARAIVDNIMAELVYDGLLPDMLTIPRG